MTNLLNYKSWVKTFALFSTLLQMLTPTLFLTFQYKSSYADAPGEIAMDTSATVGPHTQHGTGQYYANAACPYDQSTLPAQVISRAERIRNMATEINRQLQLAIRRREEMESDRLFSTCETAVNRIIEKACGGGNRAQGRSWINQFEDWMRGVDGIDDSFLYSRNVNYYRTYEYVTNGLQSTSPNLDRMLAGTCPPEGCLPSPSDDPGFGNIDPPGGGATPPRNTGDCDQYKLNGGRIDSQICYNAGESDRRVEDYCEGCLKPKGGYPKGIYPEKFVEYYNLGQEIAELERDYRAAIGKAECVATHIDGAPSTGPDAGAFQRCIIDADPSATTADYCLYCDDAGRVAQKESGFDWNRWAPTILTTGAWILGGIYANNQMEETRQGNWEAGYPSDDRSPWVMSTYVMNGFGAVTNSLQAAGAFGCSPSGGASGQAQMTATTNIGAFVQGLFGGNPNVQTGGALGYNGGITAGINGNLSGGLFGNNPTAGPGLMSDAEIQRQRDALNAAILQNQQQAQTLDALAQLNASIAKFDADAAVLAQQRAALAAQAQGLYSSLGYTGAGAGTGTGAGLRIGLDVSGWAGVNGGLGAGLSGAPGTVYPPTPTGYPGLPNGSGNTYNGGNTGSGSQFAVPAIGL